MAEKNVMVQNIRKAYGSVLAMDIRHVTLTDSKESITATETAQKPFDLMKAETIRDAFDPGKLQTATYVIVTDPPRADIEDRCYRLYLNKNRAPADETKLDNLFKVN